VVMSDHGFGPVDSFFLTNNWLASLGLLQFRRAPWTRFKRLLFRLGYTPLRMFRVAKALGLGSLRRKVRFQQSAGLLNRLFLSFDDVDWSRTRAFSIGSFGQIYVNLAGVRPQGIVPPGEQYEALKEWIADQALALRDPRTGQPLIERVYRREEIYSGPFIERTPDLIVQPRGWEYMAFGHADFGSNRLVEPIVGLSGHHRPEGVVILAGAGAKAGTQLHGASILDLAPTILHALGVAVPQELDGRVMAEAFEATSPLARPVIYSGENVYKDDAGMPSLSDEEMDEVQEKLRGWGYAG
jgi:predicted AlkP superfamily phosphohydrolase/phosphomutase